MGTRPGEGDADGEDERREHDGGDRAALDRRAPPRVIPAAVTIVRASTISTALAPKTASARTIVELVIVIRTSARRQRRRSRVQLGRLSPAASMALSTSAAGPADSETLEVAQVRDAGPPCARTGRGCRSERRRSASSRTRAAPRARGARTWPRGRHRPSQDSSLQDTTTTVASMFSTISRQGGGHGRLRVEVAARGGVLRVDALAGDPVVGRRVPADQGLPDVVVREVAVLVVGRVEVGEVDRPDRRPAPAWRPPGSSARPGKEIGGPERQRGWRHRGAHCFR